jgi:hypothetical protein
LCPHSCAAATATTTLAQALLPKQLRCAPTYLAAPTAAVCLPALVGCR